MRAYGVVEKVTIDRSKYYRGELSRVAADAAARRQRRALAKKKQKEEDVDCNASAPFFPFGFQTDGNAVEEDDEDDVSKIGSGDDSRIAATVSHDGLRATIFVNGEIYRIEPIDKSLHSRTMRAARDEGHNHVIYAHSHTGNLKGKGGVSLDVAKHDHSTCGIGATHEHERDARDAATEASYRQSQDNDNGHGHSNYSDHSDHSDQRQGRSHEEDVDDDTVTPISKEQDFDFKHTCEMSLVADKLFFNDNGGDAVAATDKMMGYITDANMIYESTNFLVDPDPEYVALMTQPLKFWMLIYPEGTDRVHLPPPPPPPIGGGGGCSDPLPHICPIQSSLITLR